MRGKEGNGGERGRGEVREEGDGRTNPKPAATGLTAKTVLMHSVARFKKISNGKSEN